MKNIIVVYGTRPELIKLAPLIHELKRNNNANLQVVSTGQHKEMLVSLEQIFEISPDISLEVMVENQSVNQVVSKVISLMEKVFEEHETDLVFVQGDTATVLATAMSAYLKGVEIAHVEAGLRSFDLKHPFPEEFNRRAVSIIAGYNFAPTELSAKNLINEGVDKKKVIVTGNTVIDALEYIRPRLKVAKTEKLTILVTAHRRENHEFGIEAICDAILDLLKLNTHVNFIWPVHPNPNVKDVVFKKLAGVDRVQIKQPVDYLALLELIQNAFMVWTDSGGIQEEVPSFKKPVLILREVTERPEVIESGFGILVGTNKSSIVKKSMELLNNPDQYHSMTDGINPFGTGNASKVIVNSIF